jgi:hypothetical protein
VGGSSVESCTSASDTQLADELERLETTYATRAEFMDRAAPSAARGAQGRVVSLEQVGNIELQEAELEAARSSLATGTVARSGVYPDLALRSL